MATAARPALSAKKIPDAENDAVFDPVRLRAPFALRCAAFCIDYLTLLLLPALWLMGNRVIAEKGSPMSLGIGVWLMAGAIFVVNFLLLPLFRGQSVGKFVTGLTILHQEGRPAGMGRLLLRNSAGYLLTLLSLGLGFVAAAFNQSGRTLHDVIAGTIVVRGRQL
jgi:uncharacterized RDD family membrane protein YckC